MEQRSALTGYIGEGRQQSCLGKQAITIPRANHAEIFLKVGGKVRGIVALSREKAAYSHAKCSAHRSAGLRPRIRHPKT